MSKAPPDEVADAEKMPKAGAETVAETNAATDAKAKPSASAVDKKAEHAGAADAEGKSGVRKGEEVVPVESDERAAAADEKSDVSAEDPMKAKLAEDLARVAGELLKTREAYLRAVADFDNYRRRVNEEKPKLANYAKGELAKDLFPVLDNFSLGLSAAEKQHPEAKSITEGFAMIATQIRAALAQHNIVEINPVGEAFNPNEQESLTSQPSEDVPEDHVMFVHRVGYKIGDRLLRPASVVISSGKPSA